MTIIETRYRDIPWEEAECDHGIPLTTPCLHCITEDNLRRFYAAAHVAAVYDGESHR